MGKKIVVALGGNALGNTVQEQINLVAITAESIVDLVEQGHQVTIVHGNGPQVGMINLGMNYAYEQGVIKTDMPFAECAALSEGYIGYHLQNAIKNELLQRNHSKSVATLVTQVVVDAKDPAFDHPTKPIGHFLSKEDADRLVEERAYHVVEDSGRGYRRVIASPKPVDILELEVIKSTIDAGHILITCGGGGIPVVKDNNRYHGVEAVIDKDHAASKLADLIDADILIVLTAVEKIAINFNKPNMKWLDLVDLEEAKTYIEEGHFAPGSMLPKVEAALAFIESHPKRSALITSLEKSAEGIQGKTGTRIVSSKN
jgi:carbamate kinase